MLSCRFTFKAYAKSVRAKTTKCSLKTAEVLLDADGHVWYLSKYTSSKLFTEHRARENCHYGWIWRWICPLSSDLEIIPLFSLILYVRYE